MSKYIYLPFICEVNSEVKIMFYMSQSMHENTGS